jgi:hypothetical protein
VLLAVKMFGNSPGFIYASALLTDYQICSPRDQAFSLLIFILILAGAISNVLSLEMRFRNPL